MITHDELEQIINHPNVLKSTQRVSDLGYINVLHHALSYVNVCTDGVENVNTLLMPSRLARRLSCTQIPNTNFTFIQYFLENYPYLQTVPEYDLDDTPNVIIAYVRDRRILEFAGIQIAYPRSIHIVFLE